MSIGAARKGQSLTARALWRFGPAAVTAVLLAVPSLPGSSHSHGAGHGPVPGTARHGAAPVLRHHRAGHFITPD
jgi:hypothetical protein